MEYVLSTLNNLCSLGHDGMMRLSLSTGPSQIFEVSKIVAQQVAVGKSHVLVTISLIQL